jgi:hypothetical protein
MKKEEETNKSEPKHPYQLSQRQVVCWMHMKPHVSLKFKVRRKEQKSKNK